MQPALQRPVDGVAYVVDEHCLHHEAVIATKVGGMHEMLVASQTVHRDRVASERGNKLIVTTGLLGWSGPAA